MGIHNCVSEVTGDLELTGVVVVEIRSVEPSCRSSTVRLAEEAGAWGCAVFVDLDGNGNEAGEELQCVQSRSESKGQWYLPPPRMACVNIVATESVFAGIRTKVVGGIAEGEKVEADTRVSVAEEPAPE
jgi:hypothetical protein